MPIPPLSEVELQRIREEVTKSRAEQGLPPKVTDPAALERVAEILYG